MRPVPSIVHLVPYDGVGGVETAARSMGSVAEPDLRFRVQYLAAAGTDASVPPSLNPLVLCRALAALLREGPDLCIASLWRSTAVGIAFKLLRPRSKLVLFLHAPRNVHAVDAALTRLAAGLADAIWADSGQTLAHRLPAGVAPGKCRVVSFLVRRSRPLAAVPVRPSFIFWGRIAVEKELGRALRIFAGVHRRDASARFQVIGPDGGELAAVRRLAVELGIGEAVTFPGAMAFEEITARAASASFYLQTSSFEGMGLSVIEAMQLGLVPVVTPVGELAQYCRKGINAVLVEDDASAVEEVVALLGNDAGYARLRAGAVASWASQGLYRDSVLAACRQLLHKTESSEVIG